MHLITNPDQVTSEATVAVSAEQFLHAASIAGEMHAARLPAEFVAAVLTLAREHRGVYELMAMWQTEQDSDERAATVADSAGVAGGRGGGPRAPHGEAARRLRRARRRGREGRRREDQAARNHRQERRRQRRRPVDRHPQPSLSRMLGSASMPRRATLYKIAAALGLDETEIESEFMWSWDGSGAG